MSCSFCAASAASRYPFRSGWAFCSGGRPAPVGQLPALIDTDQAAAAFSRGGRRFTTPGSAHDVGDRPAHVRAREANCESTMTTRLPRTAIQPWSAGARRRVDPHGSVLRLARRARPIRRIQRDRSADGRRGPGGCSTPPSRRQADLVAVCRAACARSARMSS